ncbi:hypothetical protein PCL_00170 [Purpureocillium lilacinum]|uniref:Uncharacterized protein n=1 Tax=Purpureocillium lilacinum TaxID=33203 RepID=A0A2U3E6B4_PURLI|nr:hypothetical protein PCL_00170 [Purpureocillium lilacinum]
MHALSAMPSAQAQRRSPKPAILRANLSSSSADKHMRLFSSAQLSAQLSQHLAPSRRPSQPPRSYTPFRLEEDVGDGGATALLRHYLRCSLPVPLSSSPARTYIHKAITLLYTLPRRHSALDSHRSHGGSDDMEEITTYDFYLMAMPLLIFAAVGIPPDWIIFYAVRWIVPVPYVD